MIVKINSVSVSFNGIRVPLIYNNQKNLGFVMEMVDIAERLLKPNVKYIDNYKAFFFENNKTEQILKSELDRHNVSYMQSIAIDAYSDSAKAYWTKTGKLPDSIA